MPSSPTREGAVLTDEARGARAAARDVAVHRRVVPTVDPLSHPGQLGAEVLGEQLKLSVSHFYAGLSQLNDHLSLIGELLPKTFAPAQLVGTLVQPSGAPAVRLQLEAELPQRSSPGAALLGLSRAPHTTTDATGAFTLKLPKGTGLGADEVITLVARGSDGVATVDLTGRQLGAAGVLGTVALPTHLAPLPESVIATLEDLFPKPAVPPATTPAESAPTSSPVITLGEADDNCGLLLGADAAEDKFRWSVFFRLVEPRASVVNKVFRFRDGDRGFYNIAARNKGWSGGNGNSGAASFVDRVAVDQPISVDGFRDQIIGVGNGAFVSPDETVPMAGTLGLGYILNMAQRWTPLGLTLGNLVYSLPLAPGEQQRVAIFERTDTSSVFDSESLDIAESQSFQQSQDTSAQAAFDQAFFEAARGGSSFDTSASSSSGGFNILIASGGSGSSHSQGTTSSWMEGQRDVASRASEQTHASLERQAAARRSAQRTSMRLAAASESESVTTKVVTNHNHTRALTLQYWEVHRLYDVSTHVDGATLVCLVPLEVVRFLPPHEALTLNDQGLLLSRTDVLYRYEQLVKHATVLRRHLPRAYQYGLTLVTEFAADPRADVLDPTNSAAEDIVTVKATGTFLPCEEIFVSAVTKRGTRLRPFRMTGNITPLPGAVTDPSNAFATEGELFSAMRKRRNDAQGFTLTGTIALPPSLSRTDIVGFELSRRFQSFDYDFVSPWIQAAARANNLAPFKPDGITVGPFTIDVAYDRTEHFGPGRLEQELSGPFVWDVQATIPGPGLGNPTAETFASQFNGFSSRIELPPGALPIAARQLAPVLRYSDVLEIEKTLQHVVTNTINYSKAVWSSLTPEERVIMLEGFTIGVPAGGIVDDTQEVPLLNCVSNEVLGFYGNSMIMPFIIPRIVAEQTELTNADIQDALTAFHQVGFHPPTSRITLPTRGVLGEAALGHCPSAEKIDLTRFWNWADSPSDTAPNIADVSLPTTSPLLTAGLTAPNALTGMAPLITNFNNQPPIPVDTSLLGGLISAGASQADFTGLTNADLLQGLLKENLSTAESARADALKRATELQSQAMTEIGNYFGAGGGEAYAANYGSGQGGGKAAGGSTPATGAGAAKNKQAKPASKPATTPKKGSGGTTPPAAGGGTPGPGGGSPGGGTPNPGTGTPGGGTPGGGNPPPNP